MDMLLDASCRVALAGLVRYIGTFAGRSLPGRPMSVKTADRRTDGEAAAIVFDAVSRSIPDLVRGDASPFDPQRAEFPGGGEDNSLFAVALCRHEPAGFLDCVLAVAEDVAGDLERREGKSTSSTDDQDFAQVRLQSLLGEVSLGGRTAAGGARTHLSHALRPFSAEAIFPRNTSAVQPGRLEVARREYQNLWADFISAIEPGSKSAIPPAFRKNWPLWMDVFDTAWLTFAQAIPSSDRERPDVSLYDHSKTTAAVAAALWRWHEAAGRTDLAAGKALLSGEEKSVRKLLLIQGDFFGIQGFIFSEGSETNRQAAKILRGRSFYVSLLTELAALRVLEALHLPSTSQIINAAGKFLIVAPNTPSVLEALENVRREISGWFMKNTFAVSGIGIAATEASCDDFHGRRYTALTDRLHAALERAKHQRFDLPHLENPVFEIDYPNGVCSWQSHLPADSMPGAQGLPSCAFSRDQILIGTSLVSFSRILILRESADIQPSANLRLCELPIFGYKIAFVQDRENSGNFCRYAASGELRRCWDFSLPKNGSEILWHGFARRNINGFVPHVPDSDIPLTFEEIASAGVLDGVGIRGLMTLKGDVDNLGLIFRRGLAGKEKNPDSVMTFARTASLSRLMNVFFAVYLPVFCSERFPHMYTVFAGGDDFFLIGPWQEAQHMAQTLAEKFALFAGGNPEVHFSAGLTMTRPSVPVHALSVNAEDALSAAKSRDGKNSVSVHGEIVSWETLRSLGVIEAQLRDSLGAGDATISYLYQLFQILEMAGDRTRPEASIWRSRLGYVTARLFERSRLAGRSSSRAARDALLKLLVNALQSEGSALRIPLSNVFYSLRKLR